MEERDLLTLTEAADLLGLTKSGILSAVKDETISTIRVSARLRLVSRAEVARYRAEHLGKRGRSAKSRTAPSPPQKTQDAQDAQETEADQEDRP